MNDILLSKAAGNAASILDLDESLSISISLVLPGQFKAMPLLLCQLR
jgi:hypothetical protein